MRRLKKIWNLPLWPGEQLLLVDWVREVRASMVLSSRPGRLAGLTGWVSLTEVELGMLLGWSLRHWSSTRTCYDYELIRIFILSI
jgi:hypothetical protein